MLQAKGWQVWRDQTRGATYNASNMDQTWSTCIVALQFFHNTGTWQLLLLRADYQINEKSNLSVQIRLIYAHELTPNATGALFEIELSLFLHLHVPSNWVEAESKKTVQDWRE